MTKWRSGACTQESNTNILDYTWKQLCKAGKAMKWQWLTAEKKIQHWTKARTELLQLCLSLDTTSAFRWATFRRPSFGWRCRVRIPLPSVTPIAVNPLLSPQAAKFRVELLVNDRSIPLPPPPTHLWPVENHPTQTFKLRNIQLKTKSQAVSSQELYDPSAADGSQFLSNRCFTIGAMAASRNHRRKQRWWRPVHIVEPT